MWDDLDFSPRLLDGLGAPGFLGKIVCHVVAIVTVYLGTNIH